MKPAIRIWADLNHTDPDGNFLLDTPGSKDDIEHFGNQLQPGMRVILYDACLEVEAELQFDNNWHVWIGVPDRESFRDLA